MAPGIVTLAGAGLLRQRRFPYEIVRKSRKTA